MIGRRPDENAGTKEGPRYTFPRCATPVTPLLIFVGTKFTIVSCRKQTERLTGLKVFSVGKPRYLFTTAQETRVSSRDGLYGNLSDLRQLRFIPSCLLRYIIPCCKGQTHISILVSHQDDGRRPCVAMNIR